MARATYTKETREEAVRLAAKVGKSEAARQTGISGGTIGAWMNRARAAGRADLGVVATKALDGAVAPVAEGDTAPATVSWMSVSDAERALEVRRQLHAHSVEAARMSAMEKRLANQEAMLDVVNGLLRQMRSSQVIFGGQDFTQRTIPLPYGNDQRGYAGAVEALMKTYQSEVGERNGKQVQMGDSFTQNVLVVAQRLGLDPAELEAQARALLGEPEGS